MDGPYGGGAFDDRAPIYQQINHRIKRRIASGDMPAWERLPSIRDMAAQLSVNANTVQRSYQELEREGFIRGLRGVGFEVADDAPARARAELIDAALSGFFAEMAALCIDPQAAARLAMARAMESQGGKAP